LNETGRQGSCAELRNQHPTDQQKFDEGPRVRAQLQSELNRLRAGLLSGVGPKPPVLHLVDRTGRPIAPVPHISKDRH
jgi:hypothetical protein